jgi:hypothetical protein
VTIILRAVAIAVAVAALIDPGLAVTRQRQATVRVILQRDDPDAVAVRAYLRDALGNRADVVEAGRADAIVVVDDHVRPDDIVGDVPISAVDLGGTVDVSLAWAPDSITVGAGHIVNIPIALDGHGVTGKSSVVTLRERGVEIARASHTWPGDGRATVVLPHVPARRMSVLTVHVQPGDGEVRTKNNSATVQVLTSERRFKAAVIERRPSWAAGFVRRVLEADAAFQVSSLVTLSRGVASRAGEPPRNLTASELASFDVVLVGAPEDLREPEVRALGDFAGARGGSVVFLPDRRPSGAYAMLLTGFHDAVRGRSISEHLLREPQALAPAGLLASEILGAPGAQVAATILAETADRTPVVFSWPLGDGRLIFSGALDAWRYRAAPTSQFTRFWRSLVTQAALAAPPRLQLMLTPAVVRPNQPARLTVRIRRTELTQDDGGAAKGILPPIAADMVGPDGETQMIRLWPSIDAGMFEGDVHVATTGVHNVRVTTSTGMSADSALVVDAGAALTRSASRIVQDIPGLTGGVAVQSSDLAPLVQHLSRLPRPEYRAVIHPLRSPWWMVPFALALCGEWALRRHRGLR